jgi:uncharacterized membrane protein
MSNNVLAVLTAHHNYQRGPPNGSESPPSSLIAVLLLICGAVIILYLYRSWLPKLSTIQPTNTLKDQVTSHAEVAVSDPAEFSNREVIDESSTEEESSSIEVVLRLLETDERRVVEALLEAGGSLLQKDISWKTGFSRVKTHRVLVRLLQRDVVTSEKYYNTNRITLSEWIQQTK